MAEARIGKKLLEMGAISKEQLDQALSEQRTSGGVLGRILLQKGAVEETVLAPVIAEQLGLKYVDLDEIRINPSAARLYPATKARERCCFPCRLVDGELWVAMVDPLDIDAIEDLAFVTGSEVVSVVAQETQILAAIDKFCVDDRRQNADELLNSVNRLLDLSDTQCKTVSILSNKGGTGKTHLAINLASCLSRDGKRVLLVDADMGNADISHKLATYPDVTLLDLLDADEVPKGIITPTKFGFDLVAGNTGEFRLANVQRNQRTRFIKHFVSMAEPYDYMLLDLGAGISTAVIDFGLSTDNMIILTTPQDVVSGYGCAKVALLRHAAIQRKLMKKTPDNKAEGTFRPWIAVNRIAYPEQGQTVFERIDVTARNHLNPRIDDYELSPRYLGGVLFDVKSISSAEEHHQPACLVAPRSKIADCYDQLAAKLTDKEFNRPKSTILKGLWRLAGTLGITPDTLV